MSTAVSRVLACLYEKNVDFQLISINMSKGEHKKPDFLKLQVYIYIYFDINKILSLSLRLTYAISNTLSIAYCYSPLAKYQHLKTRPSPSLVYY